MILYEDNDIIVCHKSAGIAVQSARIGEKDLVSMLNNYLAEQAGGKHPEPVRVVHRLDQPVEGIVVFAKNKKAAGVAVGADHRRKHEEGVPGSVLCDGSWRVLDTGGRGYAESRRAA